MDEYSVHRIIISQPTKDGGWHESFKIETSVSSQTLRDIVTVFLDLGTARERELEKLLREKNNA